MVEKDEVRITAKMGEILKSIRVEQHKTREEIAERANIGTRHLAAIENEDRMPSLEVFCRIIRALGVSSDCVVYPENGATEEEDAKLVRLIRACDARDRAAVMAMVEVLLYKRGNKASSSQDNS